MVISLNREGVKKRRQTRETDQSLNKGVNSEINIEYNLFWHYFLFTMDDVMEHIAASFTTECSFNGLSSSPPRKAHAWAVGAHDAVAMSTSKRQRGATEEWLGTAFARCGA